MIRVTTDILCDKCQEAKGIGPLNVVPTNWYTVTWGTRDDVRHFCSLKCLNEWNGW